MADPQVQDDLRTLSRVVFSELVIMVSLISIMLISLNWSSAFILLTFGVVAAAALVLLGISARNMKFTGLASHPLVRSISVVNAVFLGWYMGEALMVIHGDPGRAVSLIERIAFALASGAAIIIPYRIMERIRLELVVNGD